MALIPTLELSIDPLSDTSPTWIDISDYVLQADWSHGKTTDLDEPRAGQATFLLDNSDRRFEPEHAGSPYFPNVVPLRRLRWRIEDDETEITYDEGIWYVSSWNEARANPGTYQEAVVTCTDGFAILSLDEVSRFDPADAQTYADVVLHDRPLWYGRLGDLPTGTVAQAAAGNEGVYRNRSLLTIGVPGAILGDQDAAVAFAKGGATGGYIEVPLDAQENTLDGGRITVECWVKTTATDIVFVSGPSSGSGPNWVLSIGFIGAINSDALAFSVETTPATIQAIENATPANDGEWHHIVGVWRNGRAELYRDGEFVGQAGGTPPLQTAAANPKLRVGAYGAVGQLNGEVDEVAAYETDLSPERILAHHQAGAERGLPQQLAGERIVAAADHPLWSTSKIQTGSFDVQPIFEHGQSKLEEIRAAVKAEMPMSLFYFDGAGDPVYLGWDYKGTGDYSTPQATFGEDTGEVPYESVSFVYDDEMFNEVTISHEKMRDGMASHTVSDQTSIDSYGRRAHAETGLILVHHKDAEKVAGAILADHANPQRRIDSFELNSITAEAREQILERQIGDLIRVKLIVQEEEDPIDIVTHILGTNKTYAPGILSCRWNLARGFNPGDGYWRLGVTGFSELGAGTVLG